MMQSIRSFFNNRWGSLQAYPAAYICAIAIALSGVVLNHLDSGNSNIGHILARTIVAGVFTLPLAIAPVIWSENRKSNRQRLALVLGALYFLFLPSSIDDATLTQQLRMKLSVLFARSIPLCGIACLHRQEQDTVREQSWQLLSRLAIALISAVIV